jgi:hypothetical protein
VGAQAIIGSFISEATGVAEAEAHIATIYEQFWRRISKLWVDIYIYTTGNQPGPESLTRNQGFQALYISTYVYYGHIQRATEGYYGSHSAIHPRTVGGTPTSHIE